MLPTTKEAAEENGYNTYYPAERCARGHFAERLVKDDRCLRCAGLEESLSTGWCKRLAPKKENTKDPLYGVRSALQTKSVESLGLENRTKYFEITPSTLSDKTRAALAEKAKPLREARKRAQKVLERMEMDALSEDAYYDSLMEV